MYLYKTNELHIMKNKLKTRQIISGCDGLNLNELDMIERTVREH